MLGVVVSIENGRAENQWDYLLANFAPDKLWIIHPDGHTPTCKLCKDSPRIFGTNELPTDIPLVLMQAENGKYIQGTIPLNIFEHPKDAIYFFGSNNEKLYLGEYSYFEHREPDHIVYIPLDSTHEMFSWIAGGITLWDRRYGKPNHR